MTDLAIALAVMVAALIQGAIGVGFALIVAPIAAIIRPDLLPGAILVLMLPLRIGSTIEGSSFSGLFTRVDIGHSRINSAGSDRIRPPGSGSSPNHRA